MWVQLTNINFVSHRGLWRAEQVSGSVWDPLCIEPGQLLSLSLSYSFLSPPRMSLIYPSKSIRSTSVSETDSTNNRYVVDVGRDCCWVVVDDLEVVPIPLLDFPESSVKRARHDGTWGYFLTNSVGDDWGCFIWNPSLGYFNCCCCYRCHFCNG